MNMNGVMPNPQNMSCPHGQSKRIRLHHAIDKYSNDSDNDQRESFNENNNMELSKTTHVWMVESKFTNKGHVFPLASSVEKCTDSVFSFQYEDQRNVVEATPFIDHGHVGPLASGVESCFETVASFPKTKHQTAVDVTKTNLKPPHVTSGNDSCAVRRINDDENAQCARCSEAHIQTDTHTKPVQSSLDSNNCSLVSTESGKINIASMKLKPECDNESAVCGSFTSHFGRSFQCKRQNVTSMEPESKCDIKSTVTVNGNISLYSVRRVYNKRTNVASMKPELECDIESTACGSYKSNFVPRFHCKRPNVASMKLKADCDNELAVSDSFTSYFMQMGCNKITNVASMKPELKHDSLVNDSFTPEFVPVSPYKTPNAASMKPELNYDITLPVSDNFTSDLVLRSQRKRPFEKESTEIEQESYKIKDIPIILRKPVNISNKLLNCKPYLCEDETNVIEDKTRQCGRNTESDDSISQKNCLERKKWSNVNCVISENGKTEKSKPKNNMSVSIFNSKSRIPRQTNVKIVKRLLDYKQFSNIFQKAVFNDYLKTLNDKITFKKWQLNILQDMEELDEFLDYVSSKISELSLVIRSITQDIQLLVVESEDISVPLHYIQNTNFFNENNIVTNTRSEMLELGGNLLKKFGSLEHKWKYVLKAYKHSLVIVSRSLYKLCSIPIENKVIHERETVFDLVDKMDKLIQDIEVSEKVIEDQRARDLAELFELQTALKKFHDMDSLLDELC